MQRDKKIEKIKNSTDHDLISISKHFERIDQFNEAVMQAYLIGVDLGFRAPLDKSYHRVVRLAYELHKKGYDVLLNRHSCGKGQPDAVILTDDGGRDKIEFKTLKSRGKKQREGRYGGGKFIYSSSTRVEMIERVKEERHIFGIFSDLEELELAFEVDPNFVYTKLTESYKTHIEKKRLRQDDDKNTTASTSDVGVRIEAFDFDSPPSYLKIIYAKEPLL